MPIPNASDEINNESASASASKSPKRSRGKKLLRAAVVLAVLGGASLAALAYFTRGTGLKSHILRTIGLDDRPLPPLRVALSVPLTGAFDVPIDQTISIRLRDNPEPIDRKTLTPSSVVLFRAGDQTTVPLDISIDRDEHQTIRIKPKEPLRPGTMYGFYLTDQVRSNFGAIMQPFVMGFGTAVDHDPAMKFTKVDLPTTAGVIYTCVAFGPDQKLYASSLDGRLFRFGVLADGTLSAPETFDVIQRTSGGPRLVTGFDFDPSSTPDNIILWVSNCHFGFENVPDLTSKITRVSGANLDVAEDVIVDLPRSVGDHATNQPKFGPDGALYIPQASNTAFGAPDSTWGMRPEHLLSASILRLDTTKVTPGSPISVKTPDVGGTYDPAAPGAPLTIYASGVRLAYDLLWHSNGHLYAPTNGSSSGGNAPGHNGVPALDNISTAEDDWLFKIAPGKYHGHPNPAAGRYVLNGGNPTDRYDFAETIQYPVGVKPDPDWQPAAWCMGQHISANGVIEYRGPALGGRLDRRIMICRYSVGQDITILTLDEQGNIIDEQWQIPGLKDFNQPLDLAQHPTSGHLYVAEFGGQKITLVRVGE